MTRASAAPACTAPSGSSCAGSGCARTRSATVRAAMEKTMPSEADREAMKASHEAMRTAMRARLATFASDSFDANAFATPPASTPKMGPEAMLGT